MLSSDLGSLGDKKNLSELQEGRNWKLRFLSPALIGPRLSESGKVDEVKGHTTLLCTARGHPHLGSLSDDSVFMSPKPTTFKFCFAVYFL